jgi:hypothetical protein
MKRKVNIAALLVVVGFLLWFFSPKKGQDQLRSSPQPESVVSVQPQDFATHMNNIASALSTRIVPDIPWDVTDFRLLLTEGQSLPQPITELLMRRYQEIRTRFSLYSHIPEMAGMKELWENGLPGAVTTGTRPSFRVVLINTSNRAQTQKEMSEKLKILYFGSAQRQQVMDNPTQLASSDGNSDALMVPASQFVNLFVRDALILHELKHAQQSRRFKMFGAKDGIEVTYLPNGQLTDEGSDREVGAHRLSVGILDVGTAGQFSVRLKEIVAKRPATDPIVLLTQLRGEDLVFLDELFGKADLNETTAKVAIYEFTLGDTWIRQHVPSEQQDIAAREFYKKIYAAISKQ